MKLPNPITFAVVGLGSIGYRHAAEITKTEGFQLTSVCDTSEQLCQKARHDFAGIKSYSTFEELLAKSNFDVIVIATPSNFHYQMTINALDKGKHVLVEKPMATTAQQGQEMLDKARKAGKFLTVSQTLRYQYDTVTVKRIIDSGQIGKVFQIYCGLCGFEENKNWQIWKKNYGGIVSNLSVHLIDAAMLMIDSKPETVFAKFDRILNQGDAEDCYKIIVRHAGGEIIESEFLRAYHDKGWWHVCGTKGSIKVTAQPPKIKILVKTNDGNETIEEYDFSNDPGNIAPYYKDLAQNLLLGQAPPVTPESIITRLTVIDAARESNNTGKSTDIIPG